MHFNNHSIPSEDSSRYLGLYFNTKMNWSHQLNTLKPKIIAKLNTLSYLSGSCWGINLSISRSLFVSNIRPIIDFSLPIYAFNFDMLNKINKLQKICLVAPAGALTNPSLAPSLSARSDLLSISAYPFMLLISTRLTRLINCKISV